MRVNLDTPFRVVAVVLSSVALASGQGMKTPPLTIGIAQKVLTHQINDPTAKNTLLTCHACYDAGDKTDNDAAIVVSTYSPNLDRFLIQRGYIRAVNSPQGYTEAFTAKAKLSKYYGYNDQVPGLRLVNFRNPRILVDKITDPSHVPVQYDIVPNEITAGLLKTETIKSDARFSYEDGSWTICIGCRK